MVETVVLGSGSRGNCTLVRAGEAAVLIDAGLSAREITRRLEAVGQDPGGIAAILLTHEHGDHIAGVRVFARRFRTPVFANAATLEATERAIGDVPARVAFPTGHCIEIGPFSVTSFPVPHDAVEPVGFVVEAEGVRVGYATDLGHVTRLVEARLRECAALVLEANHDRQMLIDGPYPWITKQRVSSWQGHLSNELAAAALPEILAGGAEQIVLAHLSETNNHPGLARATIERALAEAGRSRVRVLLAAQDAPAPPIRF